MLPTHPAAPTAENRRVSLPWEIYSRMTSMGQHICRHIYALEGTLVPEVKWQPDWQGHEGGGGPTNAAHKGKKVAKL